jgi:hypothetical protein
MQRRRPLPHAPLARRPSHRARAGEKIRRAIPFYARNAVDGVI